MFLYVRYRPKDCTVGLWLVFPAEFGRPNLVLAAVYVLYSPEASPPTQRM